MQEKMMNISHVIHAQESVEMKLGALFVDYNFAINKT